MNVLSELVSGYDIPKMARVKQNFPRLKLENVAVALQAEIERCCVLERIAPGQRIAITAGSRGIANAPLFYRVLVSMIKRRGADPFIIPAMGSHGGATAQGQRDVLSHLGITEQFCGCPILSTMETMVIGHTSKDNIPVYVDRLACEADAVVLLNRIKPHTSFRGPIESGLCKMAVIGLGKQKGADQCHSFSMRKMSENIVEMSELIFKTLNVPFGIGILENAFDETSEIVCLKSEEILSKEPALLARASAQMAQIYFRRYDILILDEMGKNISGPGMDCNIISRYPSKGIEPDPRQEIVTVLDLSQETHGNAHGMGLANIATQRFFHKIDFVPTYANPLTALSLHSFAMPMILENDRVAIQASIKFCVNSDRRNPKIIRAKNTLRVDELLISEALLEEARTISQISILSGAEPMVFDSNGNLF